MGLFGNGWQDRLSTIGATLSDVGGALNHTGGGNLRQLQAQRKMDAQEEARKSALSRLQGSMLPQVGAAQPATPEPVYGSAGEASKAGYSPLPATPSAGQPQAPAQPDWQAILDYAAAGGDVSPYLQMMKAQQPEYSFLNTTNGIQIGDQRTGNLRFQANPADPNADLERAELQAKIDAYKGLGIQREASARLSGVKADSGGFAPRVGRADKAAPPSRIQYGSSGEFGD